MRAGNRSGRDIDRPKKGFPVPIASWLRSPLREFTRDHLLGSNSACSSYVERGEALRLIQEHENGSGRSFAGDLDSVGARVLASHIRPRILRRTAGGGGNMICGNRVMKSGRMLRIAGTPAEFLRQPDDCLLQVIAGRECRCRGSWTTNPGIAKWRN
jgi:hypothetical protein